MMRAIGGHMYYCFMDAC